MYNVMICISLTHIKLMPNNYYVITNNNYYYIATIFFYYSAQTLCNVSEIYGPS